MELQLNVDETEAELDHKYDITIVWYIDGLINCI